MLLVSKTGVDLKIWLMFRIILGQFHSGCCWSNLDAVLGNGWVIWENLGAFQGNCGFAPVLEGGSRRWMLLE